jgi:D-alanine-D-alanine ligase
LPYIVKPISGGSSIGVFLIKSREEFADAMFKVLERGDSILIEEFIPGVEATVGVIEGFRGQELYALPPVEIRPIGGNFFDYEAKYKGKSPPLPGENRNVYRREKAAEEIVPATFSTSIKKELEKLAVAAHEALGLRHYSRSDFIISPRRGIFILETNSLPGLTDESLVPKALKAVGSSLSELADHLVMLALSR